MCPFGIHSGEMDPVEAIEFSLKFRLFDNALLLCQEYFMEKQTTELLTLYVRAYLGQGSPIQAAELCQQYWELMENNLELNILYAQALFEHGKYVEAEKVIIEAPQKSRDASPEMLDVLVYMDALIKQRTNRHEQADVLLAKVAKSQPLMPCAVTATQNKEDNKQVEPSRHKQHGSQDASTAPECYTHNIIRNSMNPIPVVKQFPGYMRNSIQALKAQALYYFRCSKYHQAETVFRKLYKLHHHTVEGMDIYSTVLWQMKDEKTLSILAHRAVELAPSRPEAWIATGNLLSMQHNTEAAIQMFQRAASLDKSYSYALALAGHEFLLFDSLKDAAIMFRQSLNRNPNDWSAWYGLGSVYFRQDNFTSAMYYMKKALDLNPDSSVLYYVYSMILAKCDYDRDAHQMIDKALALDPQNLAAAFQKAILLYNHGKNEEAMEWLAKADALVPHEPTIAYMRGKIAQKQGNAKEAVIHFTDALAYGHPDSKDIRAAIEMLNEKIIKDVLEDNPEASETV